MLVNRMHSCQKATTPHSTPAASPAPRSHSLWPVHEVTQHFHCDGRTYCSQMHSRAEAVYFIRNCPNTKMDGDHDGIPCENDSRF